MKTKPALQEKRDKRKLFLPIFIAVILVMSAFGVVFGGFSGEDALPQGTVQMGDAQFALQPNGRWNVKINGRSLDVQTGPYELKEIQLPSDINDLINAQKIYISYEAGKNYLNTIPDFYNNIRTMTTVTASCVADGPGCENLPLKTCQDAGNGVVVVELLQKEKSGMTHEGNCYILEGDAESLNKMVDRLVLAYFGATL